MTEKELQELKLYDIKFHKWQYSFAQEVYQPLDKKLDGVEIWKKLRKTSLYDSYWRLILNDYSNLPGSQPWLVNLAPWEFERDKPVHLKSFLDSCLRMWSTGFRTLSHLVRVYSEFGLEFGDLEVNYIIAWWKIIPCIQQLVELLEIKIEDVCVEPELLNVLQNNMTLFRHRAIIRWINNKTYMDLWALRHKQHPKYTQNTSFSETPAFNFFFEIMDRELAKVDKVTLALLDLNFPFAFIKDDVDRQKHIKWIEEWRKLNESPADECSEEFKK